jgi:hypothetical protein
VFVADLRGGRRQGKGEAAVVLLVMGKNTEGVAGGAGRRNRCGGACEAERGREKLRGYWGIRASDIERERGKQRGEAAHKVGGSTGS